MNFTFPKWYDLHVHFRQGPSVKDFIQAHLDMGCAGALAMPNTKPPLSKVLGENSESAWTIESYRNMLAENGADQFIDFIVPLYLTKETTPQMIEEGAQSGVLRSCKYYPPHGTTNADFGGPLEHYFDNGVFQAMEEHGVILNIHGEEHGIAPKNFFDKETNAEDTFYKTRLPKILEKFPKLRIVCEHITTKTAANFVQSAPQNVVATITPQHLLYTIGDLLQGLKYHLYCLPLLKFEDDHQALLECATSDQNQKFFAGTDSAPHYHKVTECGCAAGCFTGGIAPQLYAQAFNLNEENQKAFEQFLCLNGPEFYGLEISKETFTLSKTEQKVEVLKTNEGEFIPLPIGIGLETIPWSISLA
ncbi:MAG: dihydroorotase [Pseudomonadota bacterium]